MAKITIEFDYFEEKADYHILLKARNFYCALVDINEAIRAHKKYEEPKEVEKVLDRIEEIVQDELYDLNF